MIFLLIISIGVRDGGAAAPPPKRLQSRKVRQKFNISWAKSGKLKSQKAPSLLVKQRQYLLHSLAILAYCTSGKNFGPLKWYTDRNFFGDGGGSPKLICFKKKFLGVVGHNPKKSGKFLSAPLIFSFPYAHDYF